MLELRPDQENLPASRTRGLSGILTILIPLFFILFTVAGGLAMLAVRSNRTYENAPGLLLIESTRHLQRPAGVLRRLVGLDANVAKEILRAGIPGLSSRIAEDDRPPSVWKSVANLWLEVTCGVTRNEPATILAAQLPMFRVLLPQISARMETARKLESSRLERVSPPLQVDPPAGISDPEPAKTVSQDPLVLILHTHTSECYVPESGKTHIFNGQGGIVEVGRLLAQLLEDEYRVPTIHSDRIHDHYPWHEAYKRSQLTVEEYLRKYPSIRVVIDVHRDGTPGLEHTTTIDGKRTSRIMLVVGTNRMGLEHPNWQKNNAFAEKLKARMDQRYAGLSLGIVKADARYNQHLSEMALIAEMGSENSTLEEAKQAARTFAQVLADVVREQISH